MIDKGNWNVNIVRMEDGFWCVAIECLQYETRIDVGISVIPKGAGLVYSRSMSYLFCGINI